MPDGWEYIRLSSIAYLSSGFTPAATELNSIGKIPYFKVSDMNTVGNEKYLSFTAQYYTGNKIKKIFPCNTIVFPKNGGAVFTNKKRILLQPSVVDLNTGALIPYGIVNTEYLFLLFTSIDFREHYKGTALPTVDANFVGKLLFGLPPLTEQERIVAEIEKFEPLIKEYDKLEQQATKLDGEIYDKLKKSILQYAIQGKLVPQDSNDEPAAVLLERIRAEKKAQLGKKYVESYIYKGDDNCYYEHINGKDVDITAEVPYELPDSWLWTKIKYVAFTQTGLTPSTSDKENFGDYIPFIKPGDINGNRIDYNNEGLSIKGLSNGRLIQKNSILMVCIGGSLGKSAITDRDVSCNQQINTATADTSILPFYMFYVLNSDYFLKKAKEYATGTATPILNKSSWENIFIPIPPLAEQKRIVEKIDEIFAKL